MSAAGFHARLVPLAVSFVPGNPVVANRQSAQPSCWLESGTAAACWLESGTAAAACTAVAADA